MGRERNNPQMKGKEEASEKMLTEKEASQLSDTKFKAMVIRKLPELTENYQKLQGNYNEFTTNYINMKKEIEKMKCEDGGNIGGSGVHFPSTPGKYLPYLRSRANSQQYSSIYEDQRPKIEDIERSDGETKKPGVLKRPELDPVRPINISSRPVSSGD